MAETLAKRVRRIISANVNDLVDSMENANADAVMREAIREVERASDDVREELGHVLAEHHRTGKHIEHLKSKLADLSDNVNLAVAEKRDDLASAAISRQMDVEGQIEQAEKRLSELAEKQGDLEGYVAELVQRRSDMQVEFKNWLAARDMEAGGVDADPRASGVRGAEKRVEKAERTFERVAGGGAFPADAEKREVAAKISELDKMSRQKEIADRLAAAKKSNAA